MKRYYFYAPSKYRDSQKKSGIISFQLKAYYAEKVTEPNGKPGTRFCKLDEMDCMVHTRNRGFYRFEFDHGKDSAEVHFARDYYGFAQDMIDWGFKLIDERTYFRLRKLALNLFYRHTNFKRIWTGRNDYFYQNESRKGSFYSLKMMATHYHHRLSQESWSFLQAFPTLRGIRGNIIVSEKIRLHIADNLNKKGKSKHDSYKFSIESSPYKSYWTSTYRSIKEANGNFFSSEEVKQVSVQQYQRLREVAKFLMWENDELDISQVMKKQDYSVKVLF